MKVTFDIPDNFIPEIQRLMDETGAKNMRALFTRAVGFYVWMFRVVHRGLRIALLDKNFEIDGNIIDRRLFTELFREETDETAPPQN